MVRGSKLVTRYLDIFNEGFKAPVVPALLLENNYCQVIAMEQGISLSDFLFLNPALNKNCSNLYLNHGYCTGSSSWSMGSLELIQATL